MLSASPACLQQRCLPAPQQLPSAVACSSLSSSTSCWSRAAPNCAPHAHVHAAPAAWPARRLRRRTAHYEPQQYPAPVAAQAAAGAAGFAGPANEGGGGSTVLSVLSATRPVDRLRYQAKFVFTAFDADADGVLQPSEVQAYLEYSDARFGPRSGALLSCYESLGLAAPSLPSLGLEQFVDVVRAQVRVLSQDGSLLSRTVPNQELGRLLYECCVTTKEMTAALVAFKLMDLDNDGFIPAEDLARTESIEQKYAEDVLEDVEDEPDTRITFKRYAGTYKRERPVGLTMVIMAAHTLAFWLLFSAPVDTIFKVLLSAFLLLKPQLINNPLIRGYQIVRTLYQRSQAELDVRMRAQK